MNSSSGAGRLVGAGSTGAGSPQARRDEIATNLADVRRRIERACRAAGRDPSGVTLVAVTKTRPAADVRHLSALGIADVGENRDQEAALKAAECADLGLRWHFVGQLQRNKAASVARYAHIVHSVDRVALVEALSRGAQRAGREVGVCCQVDLGDGAAAGRGGMSPGQLLELAEAVEAAENLRLLGTMAVAPLGEDPTRAFTRLARLSAELVAAHPGARMVSAGMSSDMEQAIAAGATHIRVGTALLGARTTLR